MCFCPLFCEHTDKSIEVQDTETLGASPARILCLACGYVGSGVYMAQIQSCKFCFIPCCCTCAQTEPMLSCRHCKLPFQIVCFYQCRHCDVCSCVKTDYCGNCGGSMSPEAVEGA